MNNHYMDKERPAEKPQEIQSPIGDNRFTDTDITVPDRQAPVIKGFVFGSTFISPEMGNYTPPKEAIEAVEKRLS